MHSSALERKTVLVAANNPEVRARFSESLKEAGHLVLNVKSGTELLGYVQNPQSTINLIVIDLKILGSNGVHLVRSIREFNSVSAPILIFSGSVSSAGEIQELLEFSVAGYVNEHCEALEIVSSLTPYLFPDSFNRRTSSRVVIGIPVTYNADNAIETALALNLSKGGLGIRTMSPLDVNAETLVRFRLPNCEKEIEGTVRVAWRDSRVGMGLEFQQIEPIDQEAIDDFVDEHDSNQQRNAGEF